MGRYLSDISWETEVWCADAPSHLIHFDGERFLGPYEPGDACRWESGSAASATGSGFPRQDSGPALLHAAGPYQAPTARRRNSITNLEIVKNTYCPIPTEQTLFPVNVRL